ncbi:hypothetical protein G6F63_015118 [Rhizopus arrhizus]|nr:hypothetical protein G6F63_015118 [Rhizopus arrhizus]
MSLLDASQYQLLASGMLVTVQLFLVAWVMAFTIAVTLVVVRATNLAPCRWVVDAYVEYHRNVPLLVQMFLWYFVLPELLPHAWGLAMKQMPQPWGQFVPAVLCLGFYGSARVAEQLRAGIQSLPRGQFQAGTALGLTEVQVYRYIILPEAFRIVLPPLTSD